MPEDQIFGIRYGLRGFLDRHAKPVQLSRSKVDGIQLKGGTVLVRWGVGGEEAGAGGGLVAGLGGGGCLPGRHTQVQCGAGGVCQARCWHPLVPPLPRPLRPAPAPCPAAPPPAWQGTSRGNAKMPAIVERLRLWGINHLYVIGGNGGNAAAHAIAKECAAQGVVCNVVGVPKSIDNDIQLVCGLKAGGWRGQEWRLAAAAVAGPQRQLQGRPALVMLGLGKRTPLSSASVPTPLRPPPPQIDRCFGFDTAVEEAQRSLISARVEARSSGGISVVKLMGRQSGFIAMNASMASGGWPPSAQGLAGGGWGGVAGVGKQGRAGRAEEL